MEKSRILFVDDEPMILEALKRMLKRYADKWDMAFMDNPVAAKNRFTNTPYDVVVSDLQMPELNGLELAKAIRDVDPNAQIIMLTGTADLANAIEAINEAGVLRFYTKPCPADRLAGGIKSALGERARRIDAQTATGRAALAQPSIGEAALNRLPVGVIVADVNSAIVYMNPPGAEIIAARDGLYVDAKQCLRADEPEDTAALRYMIQTLAEDTGVIEVQALAIERPSMLRPYSIRAESTKADDGDSGSLVMLFLTDPEKPPRISTDVLATIFSLTESESKLAAKIAAGATPDEAAAALDLTVSTVRTYLKQIFSKTGTSRQAELVKLILASPAAV